METAVIILSGGASSRMGSPKQLLPYKGKSLLRHAAEAAKNADADHLLLVTGAFHDPLVAEVSDLGFEVIRNLEWESGLASSIKAGIEKIESTGKNISVLTILLSDQPLVTPGHLQNLFRLLQEQDEFQIAASSYNGKPGVPAAFRKNQFDKLKKIEGDKGAQLLFKDSMDQLKLVTADFLLIDIDSPRDYEKLLKNVNDQT